MRNFLKICLLLVVATSLVACSATPTRRSFGEGWKDSVVSTKVTWKMGRDKIVKKRNIDVDAWRGVVTMTGRVTSEEEKERAEQLAWQVKGVRGVDNYLKIVNDAMPAAETDELIATKEEVATEKIRTKNGNVITIEETDKVKIKEKVAKRTPAHPLKSKSTVSSKVDEPVVYEDRIKIKEKIKLKENATAKRSRYSKPDKSGIIEKDLTDEEKLAREAAQELKKLRGEEDLEY